MKLNGQTMGLLGIHVEDWDIEQSFKRLTITTDYTTWITYISRRDVPENTPITDLRYWKPIFKLETALAVNYNTFKNEVNAKLSEYLSVILDYKREINDLKKVMTTFLQQTDVTAAFSEHFGDSQVMGVSQKALTEAIQKIYVELEEATGKDLFNTNIVIAPSTLVEADEPKANIAVTSDLGIIDYVKVYFNDTLVHESGPNTAFEITIPLSRSTNVRVETSVLGKVYTKEQMLAVISELYIGGGQTAEDVLIPECAQVFTGNPRGRYECICNEGDRIIIILPTVNAAEIEQIEMNDFNIPMESSIYDKYTVFTSINTYEAGTYNLDINY